jgi:hypothetical protein
MARATRSGYCATVHHGQSGAPLKRYREYRRARSIWLLGLRCRRCLHTTKKAKSGMPTTYTTNAQMVTGSKWRAVEHRTLWGKGEQREAQGIVRGRLARRKHDSVRTTML